jgi:S-adenosylmethionine-diacylglycerol 3-amino-3-carboxypropyl transferase
MSHASLRYGQVWEDADVLLAGLAPKPGAHLLSIASAGDNALALLTTHPAKVVAVDYNPVQIYALELRIAALKTLTYDELLELIGTRPNLDQLDRPDRSNRSNQSGQLKRAALYTRLKPLLSEPARNYWDTRPDAIASGIGHSGRFEQYFGLFRRWVLPLFWNSQQVSGLLSPKPLAQREQFYQDHLDTWRFRLLFRIFFSRRVMKLGRDKGYFTHVQGPFSEALLARARYGITVLEPANNPYLHWILRGTYSDALPLWLRPEHFGTIRDNLDRLETFCGSLEDYLSQTSYRFDGHNLSDVFEYLTPEATQQLMQRLIDKSHPGARLLYWNMRVPRSGEGLSLRPLALAEELFARDMAFFYSRLVIEEVI